MDAQLIGYLVFLTIAYLAGRWVQGDIAKGKLQELVQLTLKYALQQGNGRIVIDNKMFELVEVVDETVQK